MEIPLEVQNLVAKVLINIRNHPKHEFGQTLRRELYTSLHKTAQGINCCKWLAILSAQRVVSIYEEQTLHWKEQGTAPDKIAWATKALAEGNEWAKEELVDDWKVAARMIEIAESVMDHSISTEYANQVLSVNYYATVGAFALGGGLTEKGYLALLAAYNALCETLDTVPLKSEGSDGIESTRQWEDHRLTAAGANADDAAVDAAFAFAGDIENRAYDTKKLKAFWEWWLTNAIPQAWEKANHE